MTTETAAKTRLPLYGIAGFLAFFAGLCTIFSLIVTAAEAWQEHSQAHWPETSASVEDCSLRPTSTGQRNWYYVDCQLKYVVGDEQVLTHLRSRSVPSPEVWQYPPRHQYEQFEEWIDEHPQGTAFALRYNPAHPQIAVLVARDTPFEGQHTPNNLKLLGFFAAGFVVLITIARIGRARSAEGLASRDNSSL